MAKIDCTYNDLLRKILNEGFKYEDVNRKGIHRVQIPTYTFKHDFENGFPAITTKRLYWKGVVGELIWFLKGDTNIKYLKDNGINIWDKDAFNYYLKQNSKGNREQFDRGVNKPNHIAGTLGRVYGAQWRNWSDSYAELGEGVVDQISNLIKGLKENPMGTRHIVTAWNPAELNDMALPPCHWSFEILVEPLSKEARLDELEKLGATWELWEDVEKVCNKWKIPKYQLTLKWHQRSVDTFLGLPFNIASYALLSQIIGKLTNMKPKGTIGDLSNVHIYEPHLDAVKEQLSRSSHTHSECELGFEDDFQRNLDIYNKDRIFDDFIVSCDISDFKLKNYTSEKRIPAEMLAYNK